MGAGRLSVPRTGRQADRRRRSGSSRPAAGPGCPSRRPRRVPHLHPEGDQVVADPVRVAKTTPPRAAARSASRASTNPPTTSSGPGRRCGPARRGGRPSAAGRPGPGRRRRTGWCRPTTPPACRRAPARPAPRRRRRGSPRPASNSASNLRISACRAVGAAAVGPDGRRRQGPRPAPGRSLPERPGPTRSPMATVSPLASRLATPRPGAP